MIMKKLQGFLVDRKAGAFMMEKWKMKKSLTHVGISLCIKPLRLNIFSIFTVLSIPIKNRTYVPPLLYLQNKKVDILDHVNKEYEFP